MVNININDFEQIFIITWCRVSHGVGFSVIVIDLLLEIHRYRQPLEPALQEVFPGLHVEGDVLTVPVADLHVEITAKLGGGGGRQ